MKIEAIEVRKKIVEILNLEDLNIEEIGLDEPLFGEGLGLDSVDAIELVVFLDNEYGIKFSNMQEARDIFNSINTITKYINENVK